jgi:hypothetical protein
VSLSKDGISDNLQIISDWNIMLLIRRSLSSTNLFSDDLGDNAMGTKDGGFQYGRDSGYRHKQEITMIMLLYTLAFSSFYIV